MHMTRFIKVNALIAGKGKPGSVPAAAMPLR